MEEIKFYYWEIDKLFYLRWKFRNYLAFLSHGEEASENFPFA
jgi:hypothetical protein